MFDGLLMLQVHVNLFPFTQKTTSLLQVSRSRPQVSQNLIKALICSTFDTWPFDIKPWLVNIGSAFSNTRLPPELRRVLSCELPAVFLHFPLEEKLSWDPFHQLRRVLAKGRHLLQILLKALYRSLFFDAGTDWSDWHCLPAFLFFIWWNYSIGSLEWVYQEVLTFSSLNSSGTGLPFFFRF